jgi:ribonuclease HI
VLVGEEALENVYELEINFDAGTRRGNPGESGIGVYACVPDDPMGSDLTCAELVGVMTNNQAEWRALIRALEIVRDHGPVLRKVRILSDSKLVVQQALGNWQVRDHLIPLRDQAYSVCAELRERGCDVTIEHVKRAKNDKADALVTALLDEAMGKKRGY